MARSRRVTSVPLTSIGSGARISDLIPLPLYIYIPIRIIAYWFKHWYVVGIILLYIFLGWKYSLLLLVSVPIIIYGYVYSYNVHHSATAVARAASQLVRTRLRWRRACEAADLNNGPRIPRLIGPRRPPRIANERGTSLTFLLNLSRVAHTVTDLEDGQEDLVAALNARRSRVQRLTPGKARLTFEWDKVNAPKPTQRKQSLAQGLGLKRDPSLDNEINLGLQDSALPRTIATIEIDDDVWLELETSLLVVGQSNSGKSNLTWNVINGLNERAIPYRLYVIDPKQVELADLENSPYVVRYIDRARDSEGLIEEFHAAMERTLTWMKSQRLRKVRIGDIGENGEVQTLKILVIDELLLLTKQLKGGATDTPLGEILSIGRAAGYIVIANSQLSQVDTIGRIRDLFPQRACLATASSDLTNATLGPSAEQRGARCTEITEPGVGYIYTDAHGTFQRFRPPFISDVSIVAAGGVWTADEKSRRLNLHLPSSITSRNRNRKAWVYRLYHSNGELLYVGKGVNPTKRIAQHAGVQPWYHQVDHSKTQLVQYDTEFEAYQAEEEAIKNESPRYNLVHHVNTTPTDSTT